MAGNPLAQTADAEVEDGVEERLVTEIVVIIVDILINYDVVIIDNDVIVD